MYQHSMKQDDVITTDGVLVGLFVSVSVIFQLHAGCVRRVEDTPRAYWVPPDADQTQQPRPVRLAIAQFIGICECLVKLWRPLW
ncbi:hypothetical protein DC31_17200 [Microbacterium sp. CH12i]|nr:hypothetical protein DC31_17200 [Microbacterium sp. CH12i]